MPLSKDLCQVCAVKHRPVDPHNRESPYYQMTFQKQVGRLPTWADATAHCRADVQGYWKEELIKRGLWTEPPNGEQPVKHHGLE